MTSTPDVMDQEEQIDWIDALEPVELKSRLIKAVQEYPTSEDVWSLLMDIISMET